MNYIVIYKAAPSTRTDFSVHHSRREAAGPFCPANELYEFYLYFYSIADEDSGWSPTHKHFFALFDSSI